MNYFEFRNGELHAENVALSNLGSQFGTPLYVYSRTALSSVFRDFDKAFKDHNHLVCYAVKANSNLAILNLFARLGSGFDIVSGGELKRVLAAGGDARKVVFSGVGKSAGEMQLALEANILCFNIESEQELERLNQIAGEMGKKAPISLRVNPDVDPRTHPYISTGLKGNKFGIPIIDAPMVYRKAIKLPNIKVTGIDCHIGSQITEISPFEDALDKVLMLLDDLEAAGIPIHHLDFGGGLGIRYASETPPSVSEYVDAMLVKMGNRSQKILIEPGRALVGNAGILLTKVEYLKHGETKNFAIVDAAMNDLMRPAIYDAWHNIVAIKENRDQPASYEIVGPVCESGDFLGRDRQLSLAEGDFLAVLSAGAYGMSMSSNYNSRPRAAEVMVDGDNAYLIRKREVIEQLYKLEKLIP